MTPRGRPRLTPDEESILLSVRVSAKQLETAQRQADEARLSLAEWVRRLIDGGIFVNNNRQ